MGRDTCAKLNRNASEANLIQISQATFPPSRVVTADHQLKCFLCFVGQFLVSSVYVVHQIYTIHFDEPPSPGGSRRSAHRRSSPIVDLVTVNFINPRVNLDYY